MRIQAETIIGESEGDVKKALKELAQQVDSPLNKPDLLEAMYLLCEKLISRVEEFSVIISDESSGRLVSLLVKNLFDRKRSSPVPITFLLGGRLDSPQRKNVIDYLRQHRSKLQNALIVSEYLESGDSMAEFLADFRLQNLKAKVAAVSAIGVGNRYSRLFPEELIAGKLSSSVGIWLHDESLATGVDKNFAEGPFPNRIKDEDETWSQQKKIRMQHSVNQARRDIALIAEVFAQMFGLPR